MWVLPRTKWLVSVLSFFADDLVRTVPQLQVSITRRLGRLLVRHFGLCEDYTSSKTDSSLTLGHRLGYERFCILCCNSSSNHHVSPKNKYFNLVTEGDDAQWFWQFTSSYTDNYIVHNHSRVYRVTPIPNFSLSNNNPTRTTTPRK